MKIRLIAAASLIALTATACGGGDAGSSGKQTVTLWMYPVIADSAASQQFWSDTEKSFEAQNSTVDLVIELQPWEGRDEKIATAIASGKGPDLVVLGPDQIPQNQANGGLQAMTSVVEPDKSAYLPSAIDAATVDGTIYGVPIYHTITTAVFNKKVFSDAGIDKMPETWDEIKAAAPKLAKNGVAVMDYSGAPETTLNLSFYPLLWQAGGQVFSDDGKTVAFNSAEGKKALQFLLDLQKDKGLPSDAATKSNVVEGSGLASGKTAMGYAMTMADAKTMGKGVGESDVVVGSPLKDVDQVAFGLPGLLARTSISKDEASANAVASYIAAPETAQKLAQASGFFPARTDVEMTGGNAMTKEFAAALSSAKAGEPNPKARQVMAALAPQLQAALQGSKSVDQALADAEKEANGLLQS